MENQCLLDLSVWRFIALSRLLDQQLPHKDNRAQLHHTQLAHPGKNTRTKSLLLELQFAPLDDELCDRLQFFPQGD